MAHNDIRLRLDPGRSCTWIVQIEVDVYIFHTDFGVCRNGCERSIGILEDGNRIAVINRPILVHSNLVKQKHQSEVAGGKILNREGLVCLNQRYFCVVKFKKTNGIAQIYISKCKYGPGSCRPYIKNIAVNNRVLDLSCSTDSAATFRSRAEAQ